MFDLAEIMTVLVEPHYQRAGVKEGDRGLHNILISLAPMDGVVQLRGVSDIVPALIIDCGRLRSSAETLPRTTPSLVEGS